ncbi:zinc finger protein 699 [Ixodes scapularis]|nr:zinc finger protein 699 [Ixodes scapularis]
MPAKIFIDLATKPFVADVVFPNGLPPGGFVTLFVGCCQKTPQPGKVVDSIIVPKSSTSVPVIRKTCHNQTYTEFCDGKIFVRNDVANFQVAAYPCSLRSSTSSPVLTSQEHGRLHIQKEVPDLCGNIVPFPKSELHYCHRCSFFSLLREEKLHHDSLHGGSRQQCLLCRRFFKNGTTLNQHLCLHLQRCVRCDVCSRIFSSKEARARHLERNCDAPPIVEPTRPLIQLLPPPPPEPVVVEVAPVASNLTVEVPSPPDDTACASASVSPLPETQTPPHKQTDQGGKQPKVKSLQIRRTRHPCPYCPRFCFSMGAYQAHLRRKHINMAPLKCPRCPKRFFLDHQFYKHRSICLRKAKGLKGTPYSPKNRWNRLNCEHCEFFTHRYKLLTNHYAKEHKEHALSTCTQCNAVFAHYAFMLAHQVQVHFDPEDAHTKECSLCSTQLESVDALRDHVLAIHAAALIYRCIECHERFMTLSILLQHREEKHNPKSRKCPECPKEFSTSVACRRHVMYTHYSSRLRFPCKYCFRRYKDLLNLHYHMALSHIHELSEEEKKSLVAVKRRCQQCDYETYNRRSMQGHMRRNHGSLLQCRQCEQKFSLPAELTRHMRLRHSAQGRQDCPHCTRSFVCPKAHALHVTMHQDGSGHECSKCKRLFESEALLKHHQESHLSDAKGRRCQVCLRCFTTPRRLAEHQATFRSKEPGSEGQLTCANVRKVPAKKRDRRDLKIQCDKCHLRFKYQSSWQAHCMSAHGKRPTNADSGYTCEICKHTFVSVLGLSNHIRSHTGERPFRCKECGAAFLQPGTLKEHVVLKHSRAFSNSCPFCNKGFVGKNKLRRHLQAAHKAVVVRALPAAPRRP